MILIDACALEEKLWRLRVQYQMLDDTQTADKIMHGIFRAEQIIADAPTIDAVPVIRCRECLYYYGDYKYCFNDIFAKPNGFCSYAKREEGKDPCTQSKP